MKGNGGGGEGGGGRRRRRRRRRWRKDEAIVSEGRQGKQCSSRLVLRMGSVRASDFDNCSCGQLMATDGQGWLWISKIGFARDGKHGFIVSLTDEKYGMAHYQVRKIVRLNFVGLKQIVSLSTTGIRMDFFLIEAKTISNSKRYQFICLIDVSTKRFLRPEFFIVVSNSWKTTALTVSQNARKK